MSAIEAQPAERPVLVHLSPLPDCRNGIADYAAAILMRLCADYECICVVDDPAQISPDIHAVAHVISCEEYKAIAPDLAHERHLAHIGNNTDHMNILDVLSITPGVVVLHDLTLHYLMECWARQNFGSPRHISDVSWMFHGAYAAEILFSKFTKGVPAQFIFGEANCLPFLNGAARSLIVHSQYGRVLATAAGFDKPISVIPHFAQVPAAQEKTQDRSRFRARYGIGPDTTVFASLGFVVPNKQISLVLQTLHDLPRDMGDWRYVIAGENKDPAVPKLIRKLGLEDRVIVLDYLEDSEFGTLLSACDVAVNLRFPTSGETSGTVCRALAHGTPCIVSNHGWYAELPETVTYRIDPGKRAAADLRAVLASCLMAPDLVAQKSTAATTYAEQKLALETAVDGYRTLIEQTYAGTPHTPHAAPATPRFPEPDFHSSGLEGHPHDLLPALLEQHYAWVSDAQTVQRVVIPAQGPALDGIATQPADTDVMRQAFSAITVEDGFGGMVLMAADAAAALRPNDLLTVALLSYLPDSMYHLTADTLEEQIRAILASAGFQYIATTTTPVTPTTVEGNSCRIILVNARKVTLTEPVLEGFTLCH